MIDNNKAKEIFKQYVKNYNDEEPRIALKIVHTYRVAELSKQIAEQIGINSDLAELIGLLHDIGRFEQLKQYDSFDDKLTVDHAKLGVEILTANENELLNKFCPDTSYHSTIITAINNHNKFEIEDGLEPDVLAQCKIIRDADKIDILNLCRFEEMQTLYKVKEINNEEISSNIYESVLKNEMIKREDNKTNLDKWISNVCFVYNIYYKTSMKILKEKNYINELMDRVESDKNHEKLLNIRNHINGYIDGAIDGHMV